jgi:succinyl-diaminopimelate desuccinylase
VLLNLLTALQARRLDEGYPEFQPSNLEITRIDVPNTATNVIPGVARAQLNIRFNPNHTGAALAQWIESEAQAAAEGFNGSVSVEPQISGEAFLTAPGPFTDLVAAAVADVAGRAPELSTTGGTSDARFIKDYCPVLELGLVGRTAHQVDECTPLKELVALTAIYRSIIERYLA